MCIVCLYIPSLVYSFRLDVLKPAYPNRILLFVIMIRLVKLGKNTDHENMIDFIRVSRNFLIKIRQFKNSKCSFSPDFRFKRNGVPYTQFIVDELCTTEDVYEYLCEVVGYQDINSETFAQENNKAELIKAKPELKKTIQALEDLKCFKGSIFNILEYVENYGNDNLPNELEQLFVEENSIKIIQALLSIGDYGIRFGSSLLGDRYFYGNKKDWYEILTYQGSREFTEIINRFIKTYHDYYSGNISKALDAIIRDNISNIDINDWRYCLIKYKSTLEDTNKLNQPNISFAFENVGNRIILHRMNKLSLLSSHTVPEYIEAARQLKEKCDSLVEGGNSSDPGRLDIIYSLPNEYNTASIWIRLSDSDYPELYYGNDREEIVVDNARARYKRKKLDKKDTVERLVAMGEIVYEELEKEFGQD